MTALKQTYERSIAVSERLSERVKTTRRAKYEDRPELIGANLLLDVMEVILADSRRSMRSEYEASREGDEFEQSLTQNVIAGAARGGTNMVSLFMGVLDRPHGRPFDPFFAPISRLARMIAPENELLANATSSSAPYHVTQAINIHLPGYGSKGDELGEAVIEQVRALPNLVVLRYPETEERDSFQHLLLGHEVAHLALRVVGDQIARDAFKTFKEEADEKLLVGDRGAHLPDRSQRWFTEMACDRIGFQLVGPAFYLALYEHALLSSWYYKADAVSLKDADSKYNNYPPIAWRLQALHPLIDQYLPGPEARKQSPWKEIVAVFESIKSEIPEVTDADAAPEMEIVKTAMDALGTKESDLLGAKYEPRLGEALPTEDLAGMLGQHAHYPPDQFKKDMPIVWEKLAAGIVPAERLLFRGEVPIPLAGKWNSSKPWSVPIDWRSIVNGGFFHWQAAYMSGDNSPSEIAETRREAVEVARGGVELSETHLTAIRLRDELKVLSLS